MRGVNGGERPTNGDDLESLLSARRSANREVIDVDEESADFLIFSLGGERFAFKGRDIREILPPTKVFPVPGCPRSLEGVVNVRGDIESVIEFDAMLGIGQRERDPSRAILIGEAGGVRSGIRVDKVIDVVSVPLSSIQAPHSAVPERLGPVATGIIPYLDGAATVLDLAKIFHDYAAGLG